MELSVLLLTVLIEQVFSGGNSIYFSSNSLQFSSSSSFPFDFECLSNLKNDYNILDNSIHSFISDTDLYAIESINSTLKTIKEVNQLPSDDPNRIWLDLLIQLRNIFASTKELMEIGLVPDFELSCNIDPILLTDDFDAKISFIEKNVEILHEEIENYKDLSDAAYLRKIDLPELDEHGTSIYKDLTGISTEQIYMKFATISNYELQGGNLKMFKLEITKLAAVCMLETIPRITEERPKELPLICDPQYSHEITFCGLSKLICYVPEQLTWNEAQRNCLAHGMSLFRLSNEKVYKEFISHVGDVNDSWINGRQYEVGKWRSMPDKLKLYRDMSWMQIKEDLNCLKITKPNLLSSVRSEQCSNKFSSFCEFYP